MLLRLPYRVFVNDGRRFFCKGTRGPQERQPLKWDVVSAICLERRSVITKELTELEKQMASYWSQVEVEQSLKSDFEVRESAETLQASKSSKESEQRGMKSSAEVHILSTQDILDKWQKELGEVTLAPRVTEADTKEDIKSVDRKLDSGLFLLIRQKDTGDRWVFPQGVCKEKETLRKSAERILKDQCGPNVNARFLSNAPCGFFKYTYPKSFREKEGNSYGAKVFFYKAELLGGQVNSSAFQWRTKEELLRIVDKKYGKSLDKFLYDEN